MTDETLREYITSYVPQGKGEIQLYKKDDYNFTFMVVDNKAIGVVLDMSIGPHIHILEEYRNKGYGFRLLKQHFIKNGLLLRNKYVFCDCKTEEGLALIEKFKLRESRTYKVIKVDREKYIILKDDRVKYTILESDI